MNKNNRIILAGCVLALLVALPLVALAIRKGQVDDKAKDAEPAKQDQPLAMVMPETYWVIGPFGPGRSNSYEPERQPDPAMPCHAPSGEELRWVAKTIIPGANCLDFRKALLQPNTDDTAAYALTYVYSPEEQSGKMLVGSDDAISIWLNGVLVHDNPVLRLGKADQDQVPVVWRQNWNTVLFKVGNGKNDHLLFAKFLAPEPLRTSMSNKIAP